MGRLDDNIDEGSLRQYFSQFGPLKNVTLMYDRVSHRPRGFGFVIFESPGDASKAWGLHPDLGRMVEAKKAEPRPDSRSRDRRCVSPKRRNTAHSVESLSSSDPFRSRPGMSSMRALIIRDFCMQAVGQIQTYRNPATRHIHQILTLPNAQELSIMARSLTFPTPRLPTTQRSPSTQRIIQMCIRKVLFLSNPWANRPQVRASMHAHVTSFLTRRSSEPLPAISYPSIATTPTDHFLAKNGPTCCGYQERRQVI